MAKVAKKTVSKKAATRSTKKAGTAAGRGEPIEAPAQTQTPAGESLTPWQEMDRVFEDFLERKWPAALRDWPRLPEWPRLGQWPRVEKISGLLTEKMPSIDIMDRDKEVVVRAEVPGIDKKDLDVSIAERTLTIRGTSRQEEKKEDADFFRHEIKTGSFSRSVLLPAEVDATKAKASFKDGVVELTLPKVRASKRQSIKLS
jgi:HSP20 family protein